MMAGKINDAHRPERHGVVAMFIFGGNFMAMQREDSGEFLGNKVWGDFEEALKKISRNRTVGDANVNSLRDSLRFASWVEHVGKNNVSTYFHRNDQVSDGSFGVELNSNPDGGRWTISVLRNNLKVASFSYGLCGKTVCVAYPHVNKEVFVALANALVDLQEYQEKHSEQEAIFGGSAATTWFNNQVSAVIRSYLRAA